MKYSKIEIININGTCILIIIILPITVVILLNNILPINENPFPIVY